MNELTQFGMTLNQKDFTVAELRVMIRDQREQRGILRARAKQNTFVAQVNRAKLQELKDMCQERGLNAGPKPTVGSMRILLKTWAINSGDHETIMEIGRHKGMQFQEIMNYHPSYIQWAKQEVQTSDDPDWRLRQLVQWANRVEKEMNQNQGVASGYQVKDKTMTPVTTEVPKMEEMMEKVQELQEELDELKGLRKKKSKSVTDQTESMGSFEAVSPQ